MPYQFNQPYQVSDFSGGFTDNYIDGPIQSGKTFENFLIQKNKKPLSRQGTLIYDSTNYQILSGANRIGRLINHPQDQLFIQSESHLYYIASGSMHELLGPVDNNKPFPLNLTTNYISTTRWKNHVYATTDNFSQPIKIYKDDMGVFQVNTAGLPDLETDPTVTGTAGTANFIYKFFRKHTYFVDDLEFEVDGPVTTVQADNLTTGTKSISSIPVLANGTATCYDTANITVEIYRTENDGTTYYFVGSVTNGTTTFSDTVTDTVLVTHSQIYTAGGVLSHDSPPPAKFITVVNNIAVYANVVEDGVNNPARFRLSVPDSPDHCPGQLGDNLELPITGLNSIGIYPILFCRDRMYRLEGIFDETGNGAPQIREISRVKGTISNNSIVQVPGGLVFAGVDQFYFTDGYQVTPIDIHHVNSFKELVSSAAFEKKITGRYDSQENRVYWGVCDETSSGDNNKFWVLDLNFANALTPESTFTKISNVDSWQPTDIEFFDGTIVIADTRGYLFKFNPNGLTDPSVNVATNPSTWSTNAVIYDYESCATSFGITSLFKFTPTVNLQAKNTSNITIQINTTDEDSGIFIPLKEIRVRNGIVWGDPSIIWNDPSINYLWNVNKMIRAMRRFPAGSLRTIYKAIQITNAYTNIYNSDSFSTGNIDATAKTLTLTNAALAFGSEIVNYFVSFEIDNYTQDYKITARNSNTILTYQDPSNLSTTALASKWLIKGYVKGDQLDLISYAVPFALVGENQEVFRGDSGGNS